MSQFQKASKGWGIRLAASALLLGTSGGCRREEPTYIRVPAATPPAAQPAKAEVAAPALPPDHPLTGAGAAAPGGASPAPGMAGAVPPPPQVPEGAGLSWTLPEGWTESRAGGMRYATLKPPSGAAEISVVVLGGTAGGELANVNRWRGQLGLPALDEQAREAARKAVKSAAGEVSVYDFLGQGQPASRMLVGHLSRDGSTWFLKLSGESAAVEAVRGAFVQVIQSLEAK
ncbi:MAG: hypothetical protein FJ086_04720 [Deltaproteobacteria bacterium]|nr:hypothetical protein [Deltaproteobacteria bacterium]